MGDRAFRFLVAFPGVVVGTVVINRGFGECAEMGGWRFSEVELWVFGGGGGWEVDFLRGLASFWGKGYLRGGGRGEGGCTRIGGSGLIRRGGLEDSCLIFEDWTLVMLAMVYMCVLRNM